MREPVRTLIEAALTAAVALGAGLAANALHADGLDLGRDYFRTAAPAEPQAAAEQPAVGAPGSDAEAVTAERLRAKGLQVLAHSEVAALFQDPLYRDEAYVFIDARNDEHYRAGHIPGAWQLDHYHLDRYVGEVLPVCETALKIVVYCHGKDCVDSELAAEDLLGFGVDRARLYVYTGGYIAWTEAGLPLESGPRGGGDGG